MKYDRAEMAKIVEMRQKLREAERHFSERTVEENGWEIGTLWRDPNTGSTYRLEGVTIGGLESLSGPSTLACMRRVYSTKRRDAVTTTYRNLERLELVKG